MIYFSELENLPTYDARGGRKKLGGGFYEIKKILVII